MKKKEVSMLQLIETINNAVNNFIWGVPAMVCIIGVGLLLSILIFDFRFGIEFKQFVVCKIKNFISAW